MNKVIEMEFLEKAEIFKALAHPTRLFIIHTVKDKKMSVKELTELVGIDISTMSKHLDILKKHKIIEGDKFKNFIYYRLAIPCVLDFMSCAIKVINKK
ncbi:MAG: winged helix-turn-helix transcriptional regulator [Bacteroidales bacterium]|jgi:ArsR family transcriptional regulator|nr:winged helix-turn-helix transcriptional regulator [Bacteroidales bacterium]